MTTADSSKPPEQWAAYNYLISFIDLLGQSDALKGQGLLPVFKTEEDHKRFIGTLKDSIGAILKLQDRADDMLREGQRESPESPFRASLSPDQKVLWDEMLRARVTTQRWSDGLVSFVCLGDKDIKCPLNGIFNIFGSAGSLCFMGLATRHPIRGAIDVAWGVEIRPGELYGAAVARAYELESMYAQYPRIVVSHRVIGFLQAHKNNQEQDAYSSNNRGLAELCLGMLAQDADGIWILHYLGDQFRQAVTHLHHKELYLKARQFVEEQLHVHQQAANSKLAFRYSHLLLYFDAHQPDAAGDAQEAARP
ncbi:MAG: hypothetical protein Q8O64_18040 [Sideroxyarcus sp.]|nr:hypothetical protein [Sideroxyarcus sp.]